MSAVIPTHRRPELVRRAVAAVQAQTVGVAEIVVVVAGGDEGGGAGDTTAQELSAIDDPRLRVVELAGRSGPSRARNAGVAAARSPWIAFCDDDDVWHPAKVERQLAVLAAARWSEDTVVSTGVVARTPSGDHHWPHRFIEPGEAIGEYLFCTRTPLQGETLLHTSTLLASRSLLEAEPFDEAMWNHEDWDWLVRAGARGASCVAVEDHLVSWHLEDGRDGLTAARGDWDRSLAWAERQRARLGNRAFSAFCLTVVAGRARASGSARGVGEALVAGLRGAPRIRNLAWFPLYAALSPGQRRRLRNRVEAVASVR